MTHEEKLKAVIEAQMEGSSLIMAKKEQILKAVREAVPDEFGETLLVFKGVRFKVEMPLTLQDLLIALESKFEDQEILNTLRIDAVLKTIQGYNLHKPLEEQDDELFEFLHPLLS